MNPLFLKDSVVYLAASAKKGTLEPFKIAELRQAVDGTWYYKFIVYQRAPTGTGTMGDRNTRKKGYDFELGESELFNLNDALNAAEVYLNQQLTKIQQLRTQFIGSS